jgi:hypothetical protein
MVLLEGPRRGNGYREIRILLGRFFPISGGSPIPSSRGILILDKNELSCDNYPVAFRGYWGDLI